MRSTAYYRAQRARVIANRRRFIVEYDPSPEFMLAQPGGIWAKRKPYDCGRTRCRCCHPDKALTPRRAREKAATRREVAEQLGFDL